MRYVLLALICACTIVGYSQNMLQGRVIELTQSGKKIPIYGATIHWMSTSVGTQSDSLGNFSIPISEESTTLITNFLGFGSDTLRSVLGNRIEVVLQQGTNLKEVEISARIQSTSISRLNPMKIEQINQKELFKAACCNLSESFETNPSVDVAFTDALTGTKQIQLLGLAGAYTQITEGNIPAVRGLASTYGLTLIPGTWIESMQLSKGMGTVINGFESVSGQLNVEMLKPDGKTRLLLNGYASQGGRLESNLVVTQKVSSNAATAIYLHSSTRSIKTDMNKDGFLDNPLGTQLGFRNAWDFHAKNGIEGQVAVSYQKDAKTGGQFDFKASDIDVVTAPYGFSAKNENAEIWTKVGYVFKDSPYKSIGLQLKFSNFNQRAAFGSLNRYTGALASYYGNLIFQNIIGTSEHQYRLGASFVADKVNEDFNQGNYKRLEQTPGVFAEYTWLPSDKISLVAGLRGDINSIYGGFLTPRVHLRYAPLAKSSFRFSVGQGRRTANVLSENLGYMASSRQWMGVTQNSNLAYGFKQERASNYGFNFTQNFTYDYREGYITFDFYRTIFHNQVVVDLDASARELNLYNLNGKSYSNSFQVELAYELLKHFDLRMAYRIFDVQTQYGSEVLAKPLVGKHRGFVNLAYETKNDWSFDYTFNWIGSKRLPSTTENPTQYQLANYSRAYSLHNVQVTKTFKFPLAVYLGIENLSNFKQTNAIVATDDPKGAYFDSSLIWGPVFGRMVYVGFRYNIKNKE